MFSNVNKISLREKFMKYKAYSAKKRQNYELTVYLYRC